MRRTTITAISASRKLSNEASDILKVNSKRYFIMDRLPLDEPIKKKVSADSEKMKTYNA